MENIKDISVECLQIYPLKSGHEIDLESSSLTPCGLKNDRILVMITKKGHNLMTIRQYPTMYDIKVSIPDEAGIVTIEFPISKTDTQVFKIDLNDTKDKQILPHILIQAFYTDLQVVSNEQLEKALADYLGIEVLIASALKPRMCSDFDEPEKYTKEIKDTDSSYFADLAPLLITSVESLVQVNKWIEENGHEPIKMIRFRPNIVLNGGSEPFWEDKVYKIKIGSVVLRRIKDCTRCKLTTFDTDKKEFDKTNNPLNVLKVHRKNVWGEMVFGQNFAVDLSESGDNIIKVGDKVEIIE
jgi:uncharacterized protein YcbX